MKTFFVIVMLFCFVLPAYAEPDLETLIQQRNNANFQIIKLSGQIEFNDLLVKENARRSVKLEDQMKLLQGQVEKLTTAIKKLETLPKAE